MTPDPSPPDVHWLRDRLTAARAGAAGALADLLADKRDIDREVPLDGDDSRHNLPETLPAPEPPPDQLLIADEDAARVRAVLERLPEPYTQVILLRARDGLSFEEVGRRLGRTPDGARMLFNRAREKFRELLEATDAG
jgi:RNA polymerase sigma-70 factor (ECF subfamily)